MNKILGLGFVFLNALFFDTAVWASSPKGISFQGVIKLPNGEYPTRSGIDVNARVLSLNNCILREEQFTGVNISNGYINIVIGTGLVGGHDKGLSMAQVMDNSSVVSPLVCLNLDGTVNGAVTSFDPATTNGARKFRLSLTIDSVVIDADFNMRSVAYAVNSETLNGKTDTNFLNVNDSKSLNQSNAESIFERFTKLDALLNKTDASGNLQGFNITSSGNIGVGTITPEASLVVKKPEPTGSISSTGTSVVGVGTNFTTAFSVGDQIVVNGETKTVTAIADATHMTVSSSFSVDLSANAGFARVGIILNSGNVGIGTANPTAKLHIVNGTNVIRFNDGAESMTPNISIESTVGKAMALLAGTNGSAFTFDHSGYFYIGGDSHENISKGSTSGGTFVMAISGAGEVGIGTNSPSHRLHVVGPPGDAIGYFSDGAQSCSITPATAGNISCSSDERLKQDIQQFSDRTSLENILKLKTVTYEWKSIANGRHTGYLAQEVEKIAPEFVITGKDGYKQVSYTGFIPWITGAIKELYHQMLSQNNELASKVDKSELAAANRKIEKIESENAELKKRLQKIEKALERSL